MSGPTLDLLREEPAQETVVLHPFQEESVERLRDGIRNGLKNQVLCLPTGGGKTEVALHLIRECYDKGKRAVFCVDRVSLLDQTSARMDRYGIPHGVIQAQHWRWRPWERIQVCSIQTIQRRKWPEADLLVIDECHSQFTTINKRIDPRETTAIGLSATPFAKGLGQHYDGIVSAIATHDLIRDGFLAPYRIFAASEPDMEGAKVQRGEWSDREAEARSLPIVGDCVAEYLKRGDGKKFIVFGATVKHCEEIQAQFLAAGVVVALYTHRTGDDERRATLDEFRKRDSTVRGLISVAALSRGFDVEDVEVAIIARPLRKSLSEHVQMLGRALRRDPLNPDKQALILDHSGNSVRMWDDMMAFFDDGWHELDDGKRKPKKKKDKEKDPKVKKCPACAHVHSVMPRCPACGHEYPRRSGVRQIEGELMEVGQGSSRPSREERQALYSALLWIARCSGYKDGAAAHWYRDRTGKWPRGLEDAPRGAPAELERWVKSRIIAFRKSKRQSRSA